MKTLRSIRILLGIIALILTNAFFDTTDFLFWLFMGSIFYVSWSSRGKENISIKIKRG